MPEPIRVALVGVDIERARPLLQALDRRGLTASCHDLSDAALPGTSPTPSGSWDLVIHTGSDRPESLSGLLGLRIGTGPGNGSEFVLEGTSGSQPIRLGEDPERVASQVGQALLNRQLERELRDLRTEAGALARQQEVVTELGVRALSGIDLGEFLQEALRALARTLDVPLAAVFEPLPGSELLLLRAGHGWRDGIVGHLLVASGRDTLVARVLAFGEPVIEEWTDGEAVSRAMPLLHEHGVRCGVSVVLAGPDRLRGVLGAYATSSRPFARHDVLFVQGVANVLAAAISRKGTEEGVIKSQERLQSVQKMEAIGRLAGGIAHDFNNLVQAIAGYTEILLRRLPEHDPLHHHALEIKRAGDRAAGLTRQLLQFARRQVLQARVLDLNAVVTNIEQLLRRLIGEDVELETELTANLAPVRADSTQIEQILMNLAVNSRDAMPDGGTLTIETRNVTLSKADQREAFAIRPGPYVLLAVTDTGIGMDAETRAHAFEPFFTTKAPGQGTGLGLSTVYGIVKQSDGYIWVDSEPAHGTRVRIYLPAVDEPVQAVDVRRPVVTAAAPLGSETLLLVEDEEGVRELISEWLTGHGYAVLVAGNGTEAIALAERHTGPIHLLIADVIMPQMGGPALAARLVPLRPEMRVIYMSGYADEAIGDPDVLAAGAAFLQKPFSLDVLVRKIREILDAPAPVS